MDYFDKNFKEQFDAAQGSDLPEGFSWEDMKEGIHEKMDANRPNRSKKWWSLLLLFVVTGCGGWMTYSFLDKENNEVEKQSIEHSIKPSIEKSAEQSPDSETIANNGVEYRTQSTNQEVDKTENRPAKNRIEQNSSNTQSYDYKTVDRLKNETHQDTKILSKMNSSFGKSKNNHFAINNSSNNILIANRINKEQELLSDNKEQAQKNINDFEKFQKTNAFVNIKKIAVLNSLTEFPLIYNYQFNFSPVVQELPLTGKMLKENTRTLVRFGMETAVVNWLEMDQQDINYNYLSTFPGFAIRPSVEFSLSKNHQIELAYQYAKLNQLFDYEGTRNYQEDRPDALVSEVVNSLTGGSIEQMRKDTFVTATQYQKVLHYNQYNFHSLQLGYGYAINFGKRSRLIINAGGEYAFHLNGKGKELDQQSKIQSFDRSNASLKGGRFAGRLAVNYEFVLTDKIGINFGFNGSKYFNKFGTKELGNRQGPLLYGVQLGIKRSLK